MRALLAWVLFGLGSLLLACGLVAGVVNHEVMDGQRFAAHVDNIRKDPAVAKQLGYADTDVSWTVVPFANSIAPGPKTFDVFIGQVNHTPDRAAAVDLTDGYYFGNQSLVVLKKNALAKAELRKQAARREGRQ